MAEIQQLIEADGRTLQEILTQSGLSEEQLRGKLKEELGIDAMIERMVGPVKPTDEEIKKYFEENKERYAQPEQLSTSHILLGFKGDPRDPNFEPSPEEKAELKTKAEATLKRVQAGEDFAKVAKQVSTGPSGPQGGDLDYNPRGAMVPEYEEAAWNLKPDEVSEIVETQFGFHIIKHTGHKDAQPADFEQVKFGIKEQLQAGNRGPNLQQVVDKLRQDAKIEVVQPTTNPE